MGSLSPLSPPSFLVIGAGSRGNSYARAVTASTQGRIAAVAEPDPFKRAEFGRKYIWGDSQPLPQQAFESWEDWIAFENRRRKETAEDTKASRDEGGIVGVFICTLDDTHAPIIRALAGLGLHLLCEKPLALSLADCLSIQTSLSQSAPRVVSIGHVLRYSPHNILLHRLVTAERVVGEVISIEHTEPVGWWHFAHSYVRGNWRRETPDAGSLLTKSCHDVDFMMWLLASPNALNRGMVHVPSRVGSSGGVSTFRKGRKPRGAKEATNCLSCEVEAECVYSAKKIYRDRWCRQEKDTGWPLKIVVPEIEDVVSRKGWGRAEESLMERLGEDYDGTLSDEEVGRRAWYGRCVYESDNNVCDEQAVTLSWDEDPIDGEGYGRGPKTAIFHMTYPTQAQCERRGRIYGSSGEISYDSKAISVHTFRDDETRVYEMPKQAPEVEKSHGGGDWGLAGAFVDAVTAVEKGEMGVEEAQRTFVGCDLEEIVRSHEVVFAAEVARRERRVVDFQKWHGEKLRELGGRGRGSGGASHVSEKI